MNVREWVRGMQPGEVFTVKQFGYVHTGLAEIELVRELERLCDEGILRQVKWTGDNRSSYKRAGANKVRKPAFTPPVSLRERFWAWVNEAQGRLQYFNPGVVATAIQYPEENPVSVTGAVYNIVRKEMQKGTMRKVSPGVYMCK